MLFTCCSYFFQETHLNRMTALISHCTLALLRCALIALLNSAVLALLRCTLHTLLPCTPPARFTTLYTTRSSALYVRRSIALYDVRSSALHAARLTCWQQRAGWPRCTGSGDQSVVQLWAAWDRVLCVSVLCCLTGATMCLSIAN